MICVYIWCRNNLKNSGGKVVFLGGFHGPPLYALTEVRGTLMQLSVKVELQPIIITGQCVCHTGSGHITLKVYV